METNVIFGIHICTLPERRKEQIKQGSAGGMLHSRMCKNSNGKRTGRKTILENMISQIRFIFFLTLRRYI